MVRFGGFAMAVAAMFAATAGHAQRARPPAPQQDAAPQVYVDAGEIVRDAADRAERNGGYGSLDEPPEVVLPPVVSGGGVTSYATNGAYLDGGGRRYRAGGSSVVTVQSGSSGGTVTTVGYPDGVASPRVRRGERYRKRARPR